MGKVWRGDSGKEGGREGRIEEYCTVERGGNGCGNIDFFKPVTDFIYVYTLPVYLFLSV